MTVFGWSRSNLRPARHLAGPLSSHGAGMTVQPGGATYHTQGSHVHKYLKIPPDPDANVCHCGEGDPDCDHWESCDGCGIDYRKHEGHDCIDGVPVQDLRALAKESRDALDACETERDSLRSSPDPVIRDPDDDDWNAFGFQGTKAEFLRIWNHALSRSPAPVVGGVPELTDEAILYEWCRLHRGVEGDPDEGAFDSFEEGVRQGYALAASRLPALKPGEVEAAARIAVYEGLTHHHGHAHLVPCEPLRLALVALRDALRAQATPTEKETDRNCTDCGNWTGCPNLAARNHRKGCDSFERGGETALKCVELTDDELDAIYPEGRSLGTYHHEIHRLLLRRVIAAGIKKSLIAGSARLVPTPPQALQSEGRRVGPPDRAAWLTVEEMANCVVTAFPNTSRLAALAFANVIANASIAKGSRLVPTPPHPLQPEERRAGPDEVVVGREEWGCMLDLVLCLLIDEDAYDKAEKFLDPIGQVRKARDGNGWIGVMADELDALRTSAQAPGQRGDG